MSLIPHGKLAQSVASIKPSWCKKEQTRLSWVNWRANTAQIRVLWNDSEAFRCYIDFKGETMSESVFKRNAVLQRAFDAFAPVGTKPQCGNATGWRPMYGFTTPEFISPQMICEIADQMGYEYSVIYAAEGCREIMAELGHPIVPGETGKEVIGGEYVSYRPADGKNL